MVTAVAETQICANNNEVKMTESINRLKGLVIAEPWISLILSGEKTWEMRPKVTSYRGPLAVIRKGSGMVIGIVNLVDCIPGQREAEYGASAARH
jgi:ASCH domain